MSSSPTPAPETASAGAPSSPAATTPDGVGPVAGDQPGRPGTTPAAADRWGLLLGVAAFFIWGGMPLFFPLLEPAGALEIIAHRVVWSLVFCVVLLAASRSFRDYVRVLRTPRTLGVLTLASLFILCNWTTYVYGVLTDRVLDAALGYFINPLLTVLLGVLVLRERLRPVQWVAIGFGAAAVVVISTGVGGLPWIALTLACSFGVYSLLKNRVGRTVGALPGLAVETTVAAPLALAYLGWLTAQGQSTFAAHGTGHVLLLMASGIITGLPLLLFSGAARRLPLSVVGMLQYLGPALQFAFGVLVFHEHMPAARWAGFGLVWVALVLLTVDGARQARATRLAAR
ncbi:EamA family transporter RarD [Xylanimonas oleitrophica]|uniref:EamA family transporter RarD n=1 Tax=Xylanimonas oleitrophica TaxID=2607479 RepID=A0A2W5WUG7_9MICO|nr:EamA family transporter RarD [Xylanimonas oleitrophica]PZR51876.1 EamA family transporter RarD [Xylanimonas oleitrophica]